jgi:hypothetical protein
MKFWNLSGKFFFKFRKGKSLPKNIRDSRIKACSRGRGDITEECLKIMDKMLYSYKA